MARKTAADAAKAKAAKQKKILFALMGVLLLALVYAYHTMASTGSSGGSPPVAASTTTTSTTGTTTVATAPPSPSSTPAVTPSLTPTSTLPAPVLVAAARPKPDTGQLQSFSHFESKDPFSAQGPKPAAATGAATSSSSGSGSGSTKPATGGSTTTTTKTVQPAAPPPSSAVIAVNGAAALVQSGSDFPVSTDPAANGLFHLVGLTQKTAKISVVGGSYASGSATLTLKVNQPVTLANTADGKRYTLELFPQGTAAPPVATSGTTTAP